MIITQSIRLRTLTKKSKLWFGKYDGITVGKLLEIGKKPYLRKLYFLFSGLSFTDDILKEINIISYDEKHDLRIEKPGTSEENLKRINGLMFSKLCFKIHPAYAVRLERRKHKYNYRNILGREKLYFSKKSLQSRNHGH